MVIGIISIKSLVGMTEKAGRGFSLPDVPCKICRFSVADEKEGVYTRFPSTGNFTVTEEKTIHRFSEGNGVLFLLKKTEKEITGEFELKMSDKVSTLSLHGREWRFNRLNSDIHPRQTLFWNHRKWYSFIPRSEVEAEAFQFEILTTNMSITQRNREASKLLYRLARNNGWRQIGRREAEVRGKKPGEWERL